MMAGKAGMASIESYAARYEPALYLVTCSYFEPDITVEREPLQLQIRGNVIR